MTLLCTHMRLEVIIFVIFMLLEESQSFQSPVYATPFVYLIATDKVITFADDLIWPLSQEYYFYRLMTFFLVFICLIQVLEYSISIPLPGFYMIISLHRKKKYRYAMLQYFCFEFFVFSQMLFFNYNEHNSENLQPLYFIKDQFHLYAGQSTSKKESTLRCFIHNISPLKTSVFFNTLKTVTISTEP